MSVQFLIHCTFEWGSKFEEYNACFSEERSTQGIFYIISRKVGILACEPVVGGSWGCIIFVENVIHYYYCQSEGEEDSSQGGERFPPFPPTRKYPACAHAYP